VEGHNRLDRDQAQAPPVPSNGGTEESTEGWAKRPLVSCITIFLDAERYIEEALDSVLAQTYDNWELLLVDDGSTDRSTAVARGYAERYPHKVRYLEHEGHQNRGMSAARNLGIAHARGELIAFLDADDVWLPHKLGEQVAVLAEHPEAAMVYGRTRYWYSWSGNPADAERDCESETGFGSEGLVEPPLPLIRFLRNEEHYPCTCSFVVRREIVERVGGFDERFRDLYEDMVFHAKVFVEAPVYVAHACWDLYRLHSQSSWAVAKQAGRWHPSNPNPARLAYLDWLEGYLLGRDVKHPGLWRVLRRELLPYRHPALYRLSGSVGQLEHSARTAARRVLPAPVRRRLRAGRELLRRPPVGRVRFGSFRRLTPISRYFGFDRGQPIDRYYVENFLARHAGDIQGRVLEIGDNAYTVQFGGDRVTVSDVLHVAEGIPGVTIVGDLATGDNIPSDAFDCIVLTQTLHLIYDVPATIRTLYRILKPGGVLLATFPGISQIDEDEWGSTWYWGFTLLSARRLFGEVFPESHLSLASDGNVLTAVSFLHGLASHELRPEELDFRDPLYQVLISVRATKPEAGS
jgi:glycosyltransferase involved in cell wall biosynthesis/SAM-dependent methyltransferase